MWDSVCPLFIPRPFVWLEPTSHASVVAGVCDWVKVTGRDKQKEKESTTQRRWVQGSAFVLALG